METFSKEIQDFQRYGTYDYEFDEGGNLVFKATSKDFNQHFLSIPLANYVHDDVKIGSFYSTEFTEFIPTTAEVTVPTVVSEEVKDLQAQNEELQQKLTDLTVMSDSSLTESDTLATKQIILELRIALGQGTAERDFSESFPYIPLSKDER